MATTTSPQANPASPSLLTRQMLSLAPPPAYTFSFTPFLQRTYHHSLPADRPICKAYASGNNCPLRSNCPDRHVSTVDPSKSNFSSGFGGGGGGFGSLVCKHWLRGLCKKGEHCEFLHEYNLRKMPECNFFVRNGYCSNGDECLYLHIDPQSKLPPCPHYDRGFCPLGPRCDKKHVRRPLCPFYLAGFCPAGGRACKDGAHPRWTLDKDMEKPKVREDKKITDEAAAAAAAQREEMMMMEREQREERNRGDRDGGDRGHERGGHKDRRNGFVAAIDAGLARFFRLDGT
ncbi:hypothetical protein B0T22DRAFT_487652 [Podospora appendiculata]|uniref:mRNA 3'-end-processing protein n=1 Tax=Podospora appendiculata TaxID=314037 RepID=A0AAE0XIH3_9PEZI|nr:hypothetical protein B0T22DRAFT_487652 [Podospora appendiculata]